MKTFLGITLKMLGTSKLIQSLTDRLEKNPLSLFAQSCIYQYLLEKLRKSNRSQSKNNCTGKQTTFLQQKFRENSS